MSKTVTLRLKEEVYDAFIEAAKAENRSLSKRPSIYNKMRPEKGLLKTS